MAFDSGGFFNSNSDSKTDQRSNESGFSDINDGSVITQLQGLDVSGKNSSSVINILDNGAIKSAFNFGENIAKESLSNSYDFARDVAKSTSSTVEGAVKAVSESARSETENIFINLQKYALYGVMIWGAVQVLRGVAK